MRHIIPKEGETKLLLRTQQHTNLIIPNMSELGVGYNLYEIEIRFQILKWDSEPINSYISSILENFDIPQNNYFYHIT